MGESSPPIEELVEQFRACRLYLLKVAGEELGSQLRGKVGPSDVVQDTFLEAQRAFAKYRGRSVEELLAWLRGILKNKLAHLRRDFERAQKRRVSREVPLTPVDSASPDTPPADPGPTPSGAARAGESRDAVRAALARLPQDYRDVLTRREWDGQSFRQIGDALGRTEDAARMLWNRAVDALSRELGGGP